VELDPEVSPSMGDYSGALQLQLVVLHLACLATFLLPAGSEPQRPELQLPDCHSLLSYDCHYSSSRPSRRLLIGERYVADKSEEDMPRNFIRGTRLVHGGLCLDHASELIRDRSQSIHGTQLRNVELLGSKTVTVIVTLLTLAFGLGAWSRAGLYCNHQDISPRFASALLGLSNTAGALPGILGVWSAGWLFDQTGNWATSLFYPMVAAQMFGFVIYSLFANSDTQEWS